MRRWGSIAGSALAVLLMGIVLYFYGGDLKTVNLTNPDLLANLIGAVAIYSFVILIGAFAWRVLLQAFGATSAPWDAERQLLVSQIGKYVPGNVAQYFGRAAMAISSGVPAKTVGLAIVAETAGILIGGCLAVVISIALAPGLAVDVLRLLPDASNFAWLGLVLASLLVLLAGASLAARFTRHWTGLPKASWMLLAAAVALYVIALLLLGVSLHLIANAISPSPLPLSLSVAVFAAAWIAGLATPGAPGGLGVRESIITLGLAPLLGGATALSVALLHRGASVLGDVVSFGLGLALPTNKKRP